MSYWYLSLSCPLSVSLTLIVRRFVPHGSRVSVLLHVASLSLLLSLWMSPSWCLSLFSSCLVADRKLGGGNVACKAYVHQHVPEDYMHIWLHTHNHVDTQRVPRQVTFTFALATRHVVCLHVDRRLCTGHSQLNMLQVFTVKIHSMRIHHAHHFMCVLYIRYSTPELINLAFHPDIHLQCSSHIQGIHSMSIKRCPVIKKSLYFRLDTVDN